MDCSEVSQIAITIHSIDVLWVTNYLALKFKCRCEEKM